VSGQLHAAAALPPGKKAPATYWIGGCVDSEAAGLEAVGKRKKFPSFPRRELKSGRLAP